MFSDKYSESAAPIKRTARSVVLSNTTAAAAADDDEKYVGRSCQDLKFKDPSLLSGWYACFIIVYYNKFYTIKTLS